MNLLYVLDTYPSLTETFIAREIEALRRQGFVITVAALRAGQGAVPIGGGKTGTAILRLQQRLASRLSASVRARIYRHVGSRFAGATPLREIQHVHGGFASAPAIIASAIAASLHVPWSFSGHARDLWVEGDDLRTKLTGAKFATSCTRAGCDLLRSAAPEHGDKVAYVPHGINLADFPFRTEAPAAPPFRILAVGRLVEKKGFADLIAAAAILKTQLDIVLTIIGDGPLSTELQGLVKAQGVATQVLFAGRQSITEVRQAMLSAHCLVAPSVVASDGDRDGLPNVLLEAAALGTPIVANSAGAITDFVDENTGLLSPPHHPAALAALMEQALIDRPSTDARRTAARRKLESSFDGNQNIQRLAALFYG